MSPKLPLAVITGATGTGKSSLALALVALLSQKNISCEIVCCDSMLVYQGLDIGTDKPGQEIRAQIPHHCIDIVTPHEDFDAGDYVKSAQKAIQEISSRGAFPLLVGGTGLYLRALTQGLLKLPPMDPEALSEFRQNLRDQAQQEGNCKKIYQQLEEIDPESAQKIHINDLYRITRALEIYEFTGKNAEFLARRTRVSTKALSHHPNGSGLASIEPLRAHQPTPG